MATENGSGARPEQIVEFRVARGHSTTVARIYALKHRTLERTEVIGVEMLDRLDQHRAVKSGKPGRHVEQRSAQQLDCAAVTACPVQSGAQARKRPFAQVDTDNAVDSGIPDDADKQVAIAAAQIREPILLAALSGIHF